MKLTFGEKMKLLRTRAPLSLDEVARKVGVHFTTIDRWERTTKSWKDHPFKRVERIARALKVEVSELTKEEAS